MDRVLTGRLLQLERHRCSTDLAFAVLVTPFSTVILMRTGIPYHAVHLFRSAQGMKKLGSGGQDIVSAHWHGNASGGKLRVTSW